MTTARSNRWEAAFAKLESMIADYHAGKETPASARPVHHEGCTLDALHEGDCVITRPSHPYAGHFIAGCLLILSMLLGGCAARAQEPTPAPAVDSSHVAYTIARCGDFTGYDALIAASCDPGDAPTDANCTTDDANVDTSKAYGANGWQCQTRWPNPTAGGRLCVRLTCEPGAPKAQDFLPRAGDGTNGYDTCGLETP